MALGPRDLAHARFDARGEGLLLVGGEGGSELAGGGQVLLCLG